jgi:Nucleotidyl transferase AbiEii toxin, Type IV TA system
MPSSEKPRHRSGYTPEETEQVRAVCLTIAVTLGAYLDDLCIVGGLVPPLLIDTARTGSDEDDDLHPGTNDLDVGLGLALLDDERYAEISRRLRAEDFEPDTNDNGNETVQRWRLGDLKVTIDFLIPPTDGQDPTRRIQNLEPDFGAVITPGLELAFEERVLVEIDGHTLKGEHARRIVPVCGPAGFVVLKALALGDRGEPKDAYDLVYVIRHTPGRAAAIAERLAQHAENHPEIVARAIGLLARDFDTTDDIGPLRAADFIAVDSAELGDAVADAHGYVDDLLRAAVKLGLSTDEI